MCQLHESIEDVILKYLYAKIQWQIEKMNEKYAFKANRGQKLVRFWTRTLCLGIYEEGNVSWTKKIKIDALRRWFFLHHRED
jgi:hypothetical protein